LRNILTSKKSSAFEDLITLETILKEIELMVIYMPFLHVYSSWHRCGEIRGILPGRKLRWNTRPRVNGSNLIILCYKQKGMQNLVLIGSKTFM